MEETPSEREVKNAEAQQTPQKRTRIFTQHQLFGLELEFELKEIVSSNEISEISQRLQLSEPQVRPLECYADLMLTANGNFTLKSLLTGFMAIDIFLIALAFKAKDCQLSELF